MKIKQQFSKCATVLALVATIGQVTLAPAQALASELEATEQSTTESTTDQEQVTEESETGNTSTIDLNPVVDIPTSESDEGTEAAIDPGNLIGRSTTSYAYTTDGDVISYPRQSMTREIGNSTAMLTKEYANGAFVTTGYITVSGEENGPAWCIEPDKPFPVNIEYAKEVYNDMGIYNILYYAALNGWDQQNEHYIDVFVALNAYLGHSYGGVPLNSPTFTSDPTVAYLLQKAADLDAPSGQFDIQNKVQTADFNLSRKMQITDWYTPQTDGTNVTYEIPMNSFDSEVSVELSDGRVLESGTGTHTVASNIKFRLLATANYDKTVKFTVNTNYNKIGALAFKPVGADGQTIVKAGGIKDPLKVTDVTATFFARLGKVKVAKTAEVTGNFVPGTVFDVIVEGKTFTVTTGADGTYELPEEFVHGTTGQIIEKSVPAGYVLDTTPMNFTIEAGETVTVSQKNDIQKAVATFEKEVEIFDAEKTKETGLPVYENIPLEGGEFTIENVNDTTAPDQETVLTPAGEYTDTIVTDDEGKGNSNVSFYNGEQNSYVLDETNEPDNYRQFEPVEFTVPYEVSSIDVVTYDFGIFQNELKTGDVHFNKKNALDLTSIVNVAGAQFLIEGISPNTVDVNFIYTSTTATDVLKLKEGTYKATEIKYPDGFTLSNDQPAVMVFDVVDEGTLEINWNNEKIQPKMSTQAYANDGKTKFDQTVDNYFYDKLSFEDFESEKDLIVHLVGVESHTVYEAKREVIAVDAKTGEAIVELFIPANTIKEYEDVVFKEYAYNQTPEGELDDSEENLYTKHDDHFNQNQTIYNMGKETPVETTKTVTPTKTGSLPSTGEKVLAAFSYAGMMVAAVASYLFVVKNRKKA